MAFYVESNSKPVNDKTFATVADIIADATTPRYAGDVRNITIIDETTFKSMGTIFKIVAGANPIAARREARASAATKPARRNAYAKSAADGSKWLTRDMDSRYSNN